MRPLRASSLLIATTVVLAGLAGCTGTAASDRPQIVVTTNILGDVVENLTGDAAEVTILMKPNADPHSFEISAQEAARMDGTDLLVTNGLGLEEGLQQHIDRTAAAGVPTVVAGDVIDVLPYSSEDANGADDPHFWTDPARMVDVVDAVEEALAEVDGIDVAQVRSNAETYRGELAELDEEMSAAFAAIPVERRALVTNHHVFGYLADRFDFRLIGAVIPGGTTLAAPSAADLRDLTDAIDEAGVRTIFAESSQPDRLIQVLASEADVQVEVIELFTESLTEPGEGADTYLTMMRANTDRIADGLTP
ncbi:zinc ABC transporter substrate-binding protein [Microbacterium sp. PI-1]|uniref:zinc ABC transporter substrate-binding protein AztC n=1 Tax=unclassified Microbacterium TaxID=2609290 RepID=UPI00103F9AA6|nr:MULTISPECIES: zinc ABC transporter substrate-binding protein AztC [unclassified Microbacterium]QEA27405.1 zinc ABC transporter substrate-binding protein [Microbacterium sp. CBA3102]TCJ23803.1 zinc ABC transporter substrate-binding protein [Microbacterium sp. PI-1]